MSKSIIEDVEEKIFQRECPMGSQDMNSPVGMLDELERIRIEIEKANKGHFQIVGGRKQEAFYFRNLNELVNYALLKWMGEYHQSQTGPIILPGGKL